MRCRHARKLISQYIDKELSSGETKLFSAHIEACAACRLELEETKELSRMFAAAERVSAPYGFATRVLAGIEADKRPQNRLSHIFRPVLVRAAEVAFACVIVVIGFFSGRMLITDSPAPLSAAEMRSTFHLDVFESAPPDSIAGAYIGMTGVQNEK